MDALQPIDENCQSSSTLNTHMPNDKSRAKKKSISTPKIDFPFEFPNCHQMNPTHQVPLNTTSQTQLCDKLNPDKVHTLYTSKPPPDKIPIKVMRGKDVHTLWNYFKYT